MKYVQRIEDSRLWKDQFEDSMKGNVKTKGAYYVVNQSGKGENVQFIPPVAQDIQMAKAKIKTYKRKRPRKRKQSTTKRRRTKKSKQRVKICKKKIKKRKIKRRK